MMVNIKQSEYVRAFSPRLDCYAKTYEANFDFREMRRKSQQAHHNELFEWDSSSSSEDEECNCNRSHIPCRMSKPPPHKYKHEKYTRKHSAKRTRQSSRITSKQLVSSTDKSSQTVCRCQRDIVSAPSQPGRNETDVFLCDHGVQTPDWDRVKGQKKSTKTKEKAGPGVNVPVHTGRPKKPIQAISHDKMVTKVRPVSPPLRRPSGRDNQEPKTASEVKSPFVPYGFKDRESSTSVKKTHNVRASSDVYPSALRALRRRQAESDKRDEDLKKTPCRTVVKRDPFTERMAQETAGWETEYRQRYVPYNGDIYQKALAVRLNPKKYAENLSAVA